MGQEKKQRDAEAGPVFDEVAEKGVLGACMLDQDAINYVSDLCSPDDFYLPAHRTIFEAIIGLHKDGADIDPLVVHAELERIGRWSAVGGAAYFDQLLEIVPMRAKVEEYARRIAKCSQKRATGDAADRLRLSIVDGADDDEIASQVERIRQVWESGIVLDKPMTMHELCRKQFEQASDWLVKDWWLWQGCGLWAAEEKSMKTTLALAMGQCVAAGRPWLSRWETKQGPVLALFEEDHERTVRRRHMMLARAQGIDPYMDNFHVLCQSGITIGGNRSRGRGRLAALIRRYRPVLVILDPIRRMTPGVDENDSRAVSDYLGWLRRQQKECGCAIMLLHHYAKESKEDRVPRPGQRRRIASRVRGSSDFLAWYDSLILCERASERDLKFNALHRGAGALPETGVVAEWHDGSESSITLRLSTADSERFAAGRPQGGAF